MRALFVVMLASATAAAAPGDDFTPAFGARVGAYLSRYTENGAFVDADAGYRIQPRFFVGGFATVVRAGNWDTDFGVRAAVHVGPLALAASAGLQLEHSQELLVHPLVGGSLAVTLPIDRPWGVELSVAVTTDELDHRLALQLAAGLVFF